MSNHGDELFTYIFHKGRNGPIKLRYSEGEGVLRFCFNNINDRLCLREVDASVHKGALCKFAGLGHAHIVINEQFQNLSNRHNATVTLNFHYIFRRVGMRALH